MDNEGGGRAAKPRKVPTWTREAVYQIPQGVEGLLVH